MDARQYAEALPVERIREIHVTASAGRRAAASNGCNSSGSRAAEIQRLAGAASISCP